MDIGRLSKLSRWLVCACALAGCDTQASTGYRGEPLLSVTGSVVLTRSRVEGPLVPAIAFLNEQTELHFLDVEVQGEFPSSFTFHVYEPPPEAAFLQSSEPRRAVGFITVVPTDHVSSVQTGVPVPGFSRCTQDDVCLSEESWCTEDLEECYTERTVCARASSPMPECATEGMGSDELKRTVFSQFEGLSLNYQILYLKDPAPADSDYAKHVGVPEGLATGYHLFLVDSVEMASGEMQRAAYEACQTAIRERAVELFNEREGTELTFEEIYESEDVSEETYEAVHALESAATREVRCALSTDVVQRIDDPLREPISVVIGPEVASQ